MYAMYAPGLLSYEWDPVFYGGRYIDFGNDTLVVGAKGFIMDMLDIIAKHLNFSYSTYKPRDGKWGNPVRNGTWDGMIGHIKRNEFDLAVSMFSHSKQRAEVVDFTKSFMVMNKCILLKKTNLQSPMFRFTKPFHHYMWLGILLAAIAIGFFTWIYSRCSPLSLDGDEKSLKENYWSVLGSLLEQGQDFYPEDISSRIVLGMWWIFVLLIMTSYTADLTGYLTTEVHGDAIRSLDQLASQKKIKLYVTNGTHTFTLFKQADPGSTYGKLYKLLDQNYIRSEPPEHKQVNDLMKSDGLGLIKTQLFCKQALAQNCEIYMLQEPFNFVQQSWIVPKRSPLLELLDEEITHLVQLGVIKRLLSEWFKSGELCSNDKAADVKPLGLDSVCGVLLIVASFYCVSLLLLLKDLLINKFINK